MGTIVKGSLTSQMRGNELGMGMGTTVTDRNAIELETGCINHLATMIRPGGEARVLQPTVAAWQ